MNIFNSKKSSSDPIKVSSADQNPTKKSMIDKKADREYEEQVSKLRLKNMPIDPHEWDNSNLD